jgi:hypothetical protein
MKKAIIIFAVFCGCAPNLPIEIYLDENWDEREETAILAAMNEWNNATGVDVFTYMGRLDTVFTEDDDNDGRIIIYKALNSSKFIREIEKEIMQDYEVEAAAFTHHYEDVVVLWYYFNYDWELIVEEGLVESENYYYWRLNEIALHELGHVLRFDHNNEDSIMNINLASNWPEPAEVTEYDVDLFCREYECP